MSEPFDSPRLAINRVYTRRGDKGETGLVGGQRVPKDSLRLEAYGTVDELNAFVGAARASAEESIANGAAALRPLSVILLRVQHELFNLGSILATLPADVHPKQARITDAEIRRLEAEMDRMNEPLPPLRSFVLPGGHSPQCRSAHLPHRVPARGTHRSGPCAPGRDPGRSGPLFEPSQRRLLCLEPLGKPCQRSGRDSVGAQPVELRNARFCLTRVATSRPNTIALIPARRQDRTHRKIPAGLRRGSSSIAPGNAGGCTISPMSWRT